MPEPDIEFSSELTPREHYPYITRQLIDLYQDGDLTNVTGIDVEPKYGYVTRIAYDDGSTRITNGNDPGLNTSAASELADDKGHTKFLLRKMGINFPAGEEFLLPWWVNTMNRARLPDDMLVFEPRAVKRYLESTIGYPAYIKPTDGSKGYGIHQVGEHDDLDAIATAFSEDRIKVAIVEEAIDMPDYRVVVLDGELISAYKRSPLTVIGDGASSIGQLMVALQEDFVKEGRDTKIDTTDPRIAVKLGRMGLSLSSRLNGGEALVLSDTSNLSTGGTSEDIADIIHPNWVDLSNRIGRGFNLRICGVDLACESIEDGKADYRVIEVNSKPGLDHYAFSGEAQARIVRNLYSKVFNAYP